MLSEQAGDIELNVDDVDGWPELGRKWFLQSLPYGYREDEKITGAALRDCGLTIPDAFDGFQAWQIHIMEIEEEK